MKRLVFILLCFPLLMFGQEEKAPNLYEVVNCKVKAGQEEAFEAAVKSHNDQFHAENTLYRARLAYNLNGPFAGMYTWLMGPTSYTAIDDRPGKGAHDDDWAKVTDMVEEFDAPTYWTFSDKLSHIPDGDVGKKRLIWMYDLKQGKGAKWAELIGKVKKVYMEKRPDEPFIVVWNDFADTKAGMDAAVIFAFDKWAWMDRESNFSEQYEEVHGNGTWHNFLNEFGETVNGRVDWMRTFIE